MILFSINGIAFEAYIAPMHIEAATDYKLLFEQLLREHQQLEVAYQQSVQQLTSLNGSFTMLKHELEQLKKIIYGSRQERFVATATHPSQLTLSINTETTEQCAVGTAQKIEYTRSKAIETNINKVPTGRMKLPESLPREQVIIEPTEDVTGCKKIGDEITEELEMKAAEFYVKQYIRPKYVRTNGEGIIIGQLPTRPIDKGIAGPGLLAQVVIDKYLDHLPLHRQMQRLQRAGIRLPYSTLTGWVSGVCKLITPLYEAHRNKVLQSGYLHADETPIKVLDKDKKGDTHRGYYWVYHNSIEKIVLFDYQPSRGREGPEGMLENFTGYLQTDGYVAYDTFEKKPGITLLHCMAHARRMFTEAVNNDGSRAEYALQQIQQLYRIERRIKEQSPGAEEIKTVREQESIPILKSMKEWMMNEYQKVLPQSPIGRAIAYSLHRWDKLSLYTQNGILQIDNNPVENSIRPVAIGRKNYLFAGSHEAAQRSAMLYSLIGTCKLHQVNPFDWFKDVLNRLPDYLINKIEELLPQNWKSN